jgi:hypothetical protein
MKFLLNSQVHLYSVELRLVNNTGIEIQRSVLYFLLFDSQRQWLCSLKSKEWRFGVSQLLASQSII